MVKGINSITSLIELVSTINNKYKDVAEITGENFNVFKILKIESNEVKTHSAFLAELLNPKGRHGKKEKFLGHFVSQLGIDNFDIKSAIAEVEYFIGLKTETTGGYIDILVTDNNRNRIIIENKIYAGDQENQLIRYHNFDKTKNLYYLTLEKHEASEKSVGKSLRMGEEYKTISYKSDIIKWLEVCLKESVDHPLLRETIKQYINLIKYLTHETMNNEMQNEVTNRIISNPENIEAAELIFNSWYQVRIRIMKDIKEKTIKNNYKRLNIELVFDDKDFGVKYSEFYYYKKGWKYCVYVFFESEFDDILIGLTLINEEEKTDDVFREKIRTVFSDINIGTIKNYQNWLWVCKLEDWERMEWRETSLKGSIIIENAVNKILYKIEENKIDL